MITIIFIVLLLLFLSIKSTTILMVPIRYIIIGEEVHGIDDTIYFVLLVIVILFGIGALN